MNKVLIRGYYGFNNFGDDALLYTLIKKIFFDRNKYEVTILSNEKIFNDDKINYSSTKKGNILKQIITHDILVFGGGSQFQDFGDLTSKKGFLFKLLIITLAKFTGAKVMQLGVSLGPFKTKMGSFLAKLSLNMSDLIVVRDTKSMEFLNEELKNKSKCYKLPDLTFMLYDEQSNNKTSNGLINLGINILPFHKTTKTNINLRNILLNNIQDALISLKKNYPEMKLSFFAFQNDENISDLKEIKKIASDNSTIIAYEGSVKNFNEEIIKCTHFVSMRFHAAAFAYMNNVPQINLAYHQKCIEFMDELEFRTEAFFDIRNKGISSEELLASFTNLIENPENFSTEIEPTLMKKKLNLLPVEINKLLKKGRNSNG